MNVGLFFVCGRNFIILPQKSVPSLLIKKLRKQNEKLKSKSKSIPKPKPKFKPKFKPKSKPKQKIKTFNEYFQECIKNKTIPKDTPHYLKKKLLNVR